MKIFKMIAVVTLVLFSTLASAHSGIESSTPKNGAMLNQPPEALMLEFTMPVKLVRVQLTDQSGESIKFTIKSTDNFETIFNFTLPKLDANSYKVEWMAMGKDAHKMKGDFSFMLHAPEMKKMLNNSDGHNPD